MPYVNKQYIVSVNDRVRIVAEEAYSRIVEDLHWNKFARVKDMAGTDRDFVEIPIEDEHIDLDVSPGQASGDVPSTFNLEFQTNFASRERKIMRHQYEDGPLGAELMASFGRQMGALFARTPEDLVLNAIKSNITTKYDGLALFHASHLIHPNRPSAGTFSNAHTSLPIDTSVTVDVALANLTTAITRMSEIPTASGLHSRKLRAKYLVVPPALRSRAVQLTEAAYLSSAGNADVRGIVRSNGVEPVVIDELGAGYGGSNTTWYLAAEPTGEYGALILPKKEDFKLVFFTPFDDEHANATEEFTTRVRGRIAVAGGLPWYMSRCTA